MSEQTDIISRSIRLVEEEIKALREKLDAPILDGTPYMLLTKSATGLEMVYSELDGQKIWRALEALNCHLSGVVCKSLESATAGAAIIMNKSGKAAEIRHIRDEWERRLVTNLGLIKTLQEIATVRK